MILNKKHAFLDLRNILSKGLIINFKRIYLTILSVSGLNILYKIPLTDSISEFEWKNKIPDVLGPV